MAISPFFSGRIPQELYDKAEEFCKETGKKKTELLVEALSKYLDFPLATQTISFTPQIPEVTKEMFECLQEQVNRLEELITQIQEPVIKLDNNDNKVEVVNVDNNFKVGDNNNDKDNIKEDKSSTPIVNNEEIQPTEINNNNLPKFEFINTVQMVEKINLTKRQIDRALERAVRNIENKEELVQTREYLEKPIEVIHKDGILVNNNCYRLFYLGKNFKGQSAWDLIPDDNNVYQQIITEIVSADSSHDNINYQADNNNSSPSQNTLEVVTTEPPVE